MPLCLQTELARVECAGVRGLVRRVLARSILLAGLVALSGASTPAHANASCAFLSEPFWQTATVDQVETCIREGENIKARDEDGETPLHYAARWGSAETVTALINAGAEINARAQYGTPLHYAARWGSAETVTALINAGAEINARNEHGWTPLHWAAVSGSAETVTALINAGAEINARAQYGLTPLHRAAGSGSAEAVTALINAGAEIEAREGRYGNTPLHYAVENDKAETVTALINAGANMKARNEDGKVPVDLVSDNSDIRDHPVFWILHEGRY